MTHVHRWTLCTNVLRYWAMTPVERAAVLRDARLQLDLSLSEVARLAECATSTVRHYERGLRTHVEADILMRICRVLRLRVAQVL